MPEAVARCATDRSPVGVRQVRGDLVQAFAEDLVRYLGVGDRGHLVGPQLLAAGVGDHQASHQPVGVVGVHPLPEVRRLTLRLVFASAPADMPGHALTALFDAAPVPPVATWKLERVAIEVGSGDGSVADQQLRDPLEALGCINEEGRPATAIGASRKTP